MDLSTSDSEHYSILDDFEKELEDNISVSFAKNKKCLPNCCFSPCIMPPQLDVIKCGNPDCLSSFDEKFLHHACQISYEDEHGLEGDGC